MIQTLSIPVPGTALPRGWHDVIMRQLRHVLGAVSLLLLFGAPPAGAIGPETPVDFLDVYSPKGFMLLLIEPKQIANLQVMRIVHRDGEPMLREDVEWKQLRMLDYTAPITRPGDFQYRDPNEQPKSDSNRLQPAPDPLPSIDAARPLSDLRLGNSDTAAAASDAPVRRVGVLIPLETKAQHTLKDGVYAEKFIARAHLIGESAKGKPLTMTRWSHFVMRDQQVRFINPAEYSRLVDPPSGGVDGSGEKIQLNFGRGVKAAVPIERTKKYRAVPLGQLGGVTPERDSSIQDAPRNETSER